jgi:predicted amidohydrolase
VRAAAIQMCSSDDVAANLRAAAALVAEAAHAGAELVALPENFAYLRREGTPIPCAQPLDGPIVEALREWARAHRIWLLGGSFAEAVPRDERVHNTSVLLAPDGRLAAVYRKIHLFDVDVGGLVYRESDAEEPGDEPVVAELEGWPVGLSVCYDLRFPELYRILALEGAELLSVPANFTLVTGKDHWELLLRARAVENQCYVAAAAQVGEVMPGRPSYGRSLIADPWGIVLAAAPDEETVIAAELDRARLRSVRDRLPSLASRQPNAYRWPAPA